MSNEYIQGILEIIIPATVDTLFMVSISTVLATILGLMVGTFLYLTQSDGLLKEYKLLNGILSGFVNIFRSIPFFILIIMLFPLAKFVVGSRIGREAALVPLTISAIPFMARLVETSFNEIKDGVIEVAITSGATVPQIVFKVLLPETLHMQVLNITTLAISLIGCSAMAGAIGGGGLGDVALRYGFQRSQTDILYITIVILVVFVYFIQILGTKISKKIDKA